MTSVPAGWISPRSDARAVARLFTSSWMNLFLLAVPLGWLAYFLRWNAIAVFVLVSMPSPEKQNASHAFSTLLSVSPIVAILPCSPNGRHGLC